MLQIVGSIRLAKMIDDFWERRYQKKIDQLWREIEDILKDESLFGLIANRDESGFLRAFSQTKRVFSTLYPNDPMYGVVIEGQINPKFISMLNDFYNEIRPNHRETNTLISSVVDYNTLRNELVKKFEANLDQYPEEYARKRFCMSRKSMFARIKINELVWGLSLRDNLWHVFTQSDYKKALLKKELDETVPIFNFGAK